MWNFSQLLGIFLVEVLHIIYIGFNWTVFQGLNVFGSPFTLDPFQIDWWAHKADFEEEMEQHDESSGYGSETSSLVEEGSLIHASHASGVFFKSSPSICTKLNYWAGDWNLVFIVIHFALNQCSPCSKVFTSKVLTKTPYDQMCWDFFGLPKS